ncbi:MAG: hypothetical protein OIF34_01400, partial [Porticoccaceae bacterium]|nr:hypothetical protein [Porticoccaceae bacterium]
RNYDEFKAEQLAKLDELERKAWEQWSRSCQDAEKATTEDRQATRFPGTNTKTEVTPQTGDPRYLNTILGVIERRSRLFGLDAPHKVAPVDSQGNDVEEVGGVVVVPAVAGSVEKWLSSL